MQRADCTQGTKKYSTIELNREPKKYCRVWEQNTETHTGKKAYKQL